MTLGDLRQEHLDYWLAEGSSQRARIRIFIAWAARSAGCGRAGRAHDRYRRLRSRSRYRARLRRRAGPADHRPMPAFAGAGYCRRTRRTSSSRPTSRGLF